MGIPFESFLPYAIILGMFGVTGMGLSAVRTYRNDGKRHRWSVDTWDRQSKNSALYILQSLMERDRRLTGSLRGQADNAVAPPGFELNSAWKLEKRIF